MSTFTDAQCQAIHASGNVLVSAGAGTGKTRTVVERCVRLLASGASLEHILMVTFTEAAAAEMRERLRKALQNGEGTQFQEQLALLDAARISTLHAFCLELIRDHFYELAIDPQVSVLDDTQTVPLMHETMENLLARCYAGDVEFAPDVLEVIRRQGGSDEKLRSLVLKLHRYTQSLPPSQQWYERELARLDAPEPLQWREWLARGFVDWRDEWLPEVERYAASPHITRCVQAVKALSSHASAAEIASAMHCIVAAEAERWSAPYTKKEYRDPIEGFFEDARFFLSLTQPRDGADPLVEDWQWLRGSTRAVLRLAQQFTADFTRAKRAQGGVDFADLEQLALRLLVDDAGAPTEIARAWQARFQHVFVDECQDINAAQDAVIAAVSRSDDGANRFLVGDVKQSIYRFRLANPAIFRGYEDRWQNGGGGTRIALAENFRSREAILDFVNPLFAALMRPSIGGIAYADDAQLKFGAATHRAPLGAGSPPVARVELHVLRKAADTQDNGVEEADAASNGNGGPVEDVLAIESEARLVATRLRALHREQHLVWDEEKQAMRPVQWRDMVVLLRSPGSRVETFAKEFSRAGIPLAAARAGFYSATEVQDLLNLLRLLDNPLQDIPFAAVLRSPLVALTAEELAALRIVGANGEKHVSFVAAIHRAYYRRDSADGELKAWLERAREKLRRFLESFERWRVLIRQTSVAHCLETVLAETHYEALLLAQPRGAERAVNVHRLLALARQYDPFQRQGLYRFLRFVAEQEDAALDQDAAVVDTSDSVRLMSIHKSKGLEFPVVALACLAAQFNFQDLREDMLLSSEFGLCSRIVPPHVPQSYPSLPWWLAKRREQRELLGEEMRLLYVAMTRARDTLILTAFDKTGEAAARWHQRDARLDDRAVLKSRHYFSWIARWLGATTSDADWSDEAAGGNRLIRWRLWLENDLAVPKPEETLRRTGEAAGAIDVSELQTRFTWQYPHRGAIHEPAKSNVSLLRRRAAEADEEAQPLFRPRVARRQRSGLTAAEVGSAHHAFLQYVDIERTSSLLDLRNEAERLVASGRLTPAERAALDFDALLKFWLSPVGRMVVAERESAQREMPFTARFTTDELRDLGLARGDFGDGDFVIVQGIVDLAVVRRDSIVLVDFKTDQVSSEELPGRVDEYRVQLKLYAAALERSLQRPVENSWLHFLAPGQTVQV